MRKAKNFCIFSTLFLFVSIKRFFLLILPVFPLLPFQYFVNFHAMGQKEVSDSLCVPSGKNHISPFHGCFSVSSVPWLTGHFGTKKTRAALPALACRKTPSGFSASFCSLLRVSFVRRRRPNSIYFEQLPPAVVPFDSLCHAPRLQPEMFFCQAHVLTENDSDSIRC